jgi:serine/threonine protein kinase/tetratricopeptide (TPR) repeat protein
MGEQGGDGGSTGEPDSLLAAIAAAPDGKPAEPLARVAHFRIVGPLGSGGMGVVYRAEDETLRRLVALKVLRDASVSEESRQRFLREARSAAAIAHPNVAVVHQIGDDAGRVYIAMELVEGESLRDRLERGPLDVATARDLALQIARGLAAAHDKGIVHRDLKPENVMITPAGVVKLLDFGLAKSAERPSAEALAQARTETLVTSEAGRILGTPQYMSPEQAMGDPLDVRSDVFSFGVVLYEMLAGTRPFAGTTARAMLLAITRDPPPPLRERAPAVDERTEAVVLKCLAKAPDDRYRSGAEVVAALAGQGSPGATTESRMDVPPTTRAEAAQTRRTVPRNGLFVLGAVGLVAVAAGWWLANREASSSPPSSSSSAQASASAAPGPIAITDHPPPRTGSPEAAAEYAAAMQAYRDAAMSVGNLKLTQATKLDPNFAAAQLRLLFYEAMSRDMARRRFAAASQNRASLSERDRDLLGVAEALVLPGTVDHAEATRRIRVVASRWHDDPEVALVAGMQLGFAGELPAAFAELDRALALDGHFALALHERAVFQSDSGDGDGVLATAEQCLALSPTAAACARRRAEVFATRGQCEPMEREARRAITAEPNSAYAHGYLVDALAARRVPVDAVRDAVLNAVRFEDEADRPASTEILEGRLALYTGDLAAAFAHELEADRLLRKNDPGLQDYLPIVYEEEIGERPKSVRLAEEFLRHVAAGVGVDVEAGDLSFVLAELRLAGRMGEADFARKRDVWVAQAGSATRTHGEADDSAWVDFYARPATTPAQAREAIAALPRFVPLPRDIGNPGTWTAREEAIGRVYLLAGDLDDAIEHLRLAAGSCGVLTNLHLYVRAHEELGEALAAKGDTVGACAQYGVVLSYWGNARPRSVTADLARAGMRRLGCASAKP